MKKIIKMILVVLALCSWASIASAYSGVSWDKTTDTYTRLGEGANQSDFNSLSPWKDICRVDLADNGSVLAVYGDPNFKYDGSNGQVMVRIPKFYYKTVATANGYDWYVSSTPMDGYKVHPAFVNDGKIADYIYLGAFEANVFNTTTGAYHTNSDANVNPNAFTGDKLSSIGGVKPLTGDNVTVSLTNARTMAKNRGYEWGLMTYNQVSAIQMLYLIEYASFISQSTIGSGVTGVTDDAATDMALDTGYTAGIGADSVDLGDASGKATVAHYQTGETVYPVSYRGIENLWGNALDLVDGINIQENNTPLIADYGYSAATYTIPYVNPGLTLSSESGYPTDLAINSNMDYGYLASAVGANGSSKISDYYNQATGNRVGGVGGYWADDSAAGMFSWDFSLGEYYSGRKAATRLAYVPNDLQQTINANAAARIPTVMSAGYSGGMGGITLALPKDTILLGQGNMFKNISMVVQDASDVLVSDVKNDGSVKATKSGDTFPAFKVMGTCNNITFLNCLVTNSNTNSSAFLIKPSIRNTDVSNIRFDSCHADNIQYHGFSIFGRGTGNDFSVSNVSFINCSASHCGYNSRVNDWVCGYDLGETDSSLYLTLKNMYLENCSAAYNWECGFYIMDRDYPSGINHIPNTNIKLNNCTSQGNGIKPNPVFGAGFRIFNGTFENCHSYDNFRGFYILNTQPDSTAILQDCADDGSNVSYCINHDATGISGSYSYPGGSAVMNNCISNNARTYGIEANSTSSITANNLTINNPAGNANMANRLDNVTSSAFDIHYTGNSAAANGIYVNLLDRCNITGSITHPNGQNGMSISNSKKLVLNDLNISGGTQHGIYIKDVPSTENVTITNSRINGATYSGAAIDFDGTSGVVYSDPDTVQSDIDATYSSNNMLGLKPITYSSGFEGKIVLMLASPLMITISSIGNGANVTEDSASLEVSSWKIYEGFGALYQKVTQTINSGYILASLIVLVIGAYALFRYMGYF